MAKLILRYPDNVIKEAEFNQPKYRIGRANDNDLVLENNEVTAHQAEIENQNGIYSILDVSEDESTTVNGKKITRSNLNYGDRIGFGPVIGLFYPAKKSKFNEKTKLFMYIGAGGLIIVLSIVFILLITTRQIKMVVNEQIKEVVPAEKSNKKLFQKELSAKTEKVKSIEEEQKVKIEKISFLKKFREKKNLVLPEPDREMVKERTAIAIPRDIRRLFFRKIPVYVKEVHVEEKAKTIVKESEIRKVIPEEEGAEKLEEVEEEKNGLLKGVIAKIKNLFKRKKEKPLIEEKVIEEFKAETITETPLRLEDRVPYIEVPKEKEIEGILNPLSLLKEKEVPGIGVYELKEEPIYSEEEIKEIESQYFLKNIKLTQAESINANILWKYPEGTEKTDPIIMAGALGKIDDDKNYDLLFGTKNGLLIALSGKTGDEILNQDMEKPFFEPIIEDVDGDKLNDIIIVFKDGNIVSYTRDMKKIWNYKAQGIITSLPLIADITSDKVGDIIFADKNMDIIAIDGETGFEIWKFFDAESEIVFSPVAVDINKDGIKDVVFSTVNGFLYAVDGKSGWGLWKGNIFGKPAGCSSVSDLDNDKMEDIISLTNNGILSCYRRDGKLSFVHEIGGSYLIPPSVGDADGDKNNEIVLIDKNGVLRAIEGKTRREKWSFETEEGLTAGRLTLADVNNDGGMDVIFTTISGLLFIIDGKTGLQIAVYNFKSYLLGTPLVFDINRDKVMEIISCAYNGEVIALQIADRKKRFISFKKSGWITLNHDNSNTGCSLFYLLKNPWK